MAHLGDGLSRSFQQAVEPEYHVVNKPKPDVLRVRTVMTGIQPAKQQRAGVIDYLPIKVVFNVGCETVGAA